MLTGAWLPLKGACPWGLVAESSGTLELAVVVRHPGSSRTWELAGPLSGWGPLELAGVVGVVALVPPGAAAVQQVGLAHARLVAGVAHELAAVVRVGAAVPVGAARALEQVGAHAGAEGPRMAQLPLQAASWGRDKAGLRHGACRYEVSRYKSRKCVTAGWIVLTGTRAAVAVRAQRCEACR